MRKEGREPVFSVTLEHLNHVEEFIELMNAITNTDRFSDIPRLINERGGGSMYTILFDEAEARGEARGEATGVIQGAITIYHDEMNLSPAAIIKKIMSRYNLRKEEAEKYVEDVLGLESV